MFITFLAVVAQSGLPAAPPAPPTPSRWWPRPAGSPELRNPGDIARAKDYPKAAKRADEQGAVRFNVVVSAKGKPLSCAIVESSGHALLDEATCTHVMKRAKFRPAVDPSGRPVVGTYSRRIVWLLDQR